MKLNNKGFSLSELVVSSAMGLVLAGIATFAFIEAMNTFNRMVRKYEAEADTLGTMYMLKSVFSQAVHVEYGGVVSAANNAFTMKSAANANATAGRLFRYTSQAGAFLIGLVNRETANTGVNSQFSGTGVYYRSSNITTAGGLFFDTERNTGGWVKTSPINATQAYARFSEFSVENIRVLGLQGNIIGDAGVGEIGRPVLSADFRLVARYHTRGSVQDWRWCPAAQIAGNAACRTQALFYDVERRVKVVFVNNAYSRATHLSPRPFGNVYMFKALSFPNTR